MIPMKKLICTYCLLWLILNPVMALSTTENESYLFKTVCDDYEQRLLDMDEYESFDYQRYLSLPDLSAPFGFTPDHLKIFGNAGPSDGIKLVRPPYSNNRGEATLEYMIELPAMAHGMKPLLLLTYNSSLHFGLLGRGWTINLSKIAIDTFKNESEKTAYLLNGVSMIETAYSNDSASFLSANKNGEITQIERIGKISDCYWQTIDFNGVKHRFCLMKNNEDDDDEEGKKIALWETSDGENTQVAEWYETYAENRYGDYIKYHYSNEKSPFLDTISVGNKNEKDARMILLFQWGDNKEKPALTGYGNHFSMTKRLKSFKIYFLKDLSTVNKMPKNKMDKYELSASYEFEYSSENQKTSDCLIGFIAKYGNISQTHKFDYYDDTDSVKNYRQFRDEFFNFTADSLIKDRTGLMKTIHTPLGGCISMDYDYFGPAHMLGDSVAEQPLPYDTLAAYKERRDSLLINYFHRRDSLAEETKGRLALSSLWLNDAFSEDGLPSRNRFSYQDPIKNEQGKFCGFASVITHNQIKKDSLYEDYRIIVKDYDTTSYKNLSFLKHVAIMSPDGNDTLSETDYQYQDFTLDGGLLSIAKLVSKNHKIGNLSYGWNYKYDSKSKYPNLIEASFVNEGDSAYNRKLKFGYASNEEWLQKCNVTSITLSGGEKFVEKVDFEYNDHFNPSSVSRMIRYVNENKTETTDFEYDEQGNLIQCKLPGNENQRMTIKYEYDRRFNQFVTKVSDSHGYQSEWDNYDYLYGYPQTIIDRNGQKMILKYDELGRIDTVIAPNEVETGVPFTIRYVYPNLTANSMQDSLKYEEITDSLILNVPESVYKNEIPDSIKSLIKGTLGVADSAIMWCESIGWPYDTFNILVDKGEILIPECLCNDKEEPFRAFTYRYNAMNKDSNIIVCVLEDGFGRVIQKQSRMKVFHPENVNESVLYEDPGTNFVADAFRFYDESGRLRAITKPIISRKNEVNDVKILTEISNLTAIEYDLLDRKTKISSSVGDSLVYSYSEDNGKLIVNSDAEYHYTADGKLLLRKTKDGYSESFAYDLYGRITNVERDGVSMRREYDGLGRLIQVLDSATGKVSFSYDESGNLAKKQGPKEDDIVEYKYQFNQLTDVIYPNSPAENLHFVYGDKNAPHNRVGLVSLATDATGVHEFYYGRQGEISKVRTSVIIPDGPVETYVTQTEYDSWNRLKQVVYPDGEILTYSYDVMGQLVSSTGEKTYKYDYFKEGAYDELGRRTHYKYCNGAETFLSYKGCSENINQMLVKNMANKIFYQQCNGNDMEYNVCSFTDKTIKNFRSFNTLGELIKDSVKIGENIAEPITFSDVNNNIFVVDEENRLRTLDKNGYISNYWYNAMGYQSLTLHGGQQMVFVNSMQALNEAYSPAYHIYLNRYFEKAGDFLYVKHIWMDDERVVSKVGRNSSFGSSPTRIERAGTKIDGIKLSYDSLYTVAQNSISSRYEKVDSHYPKSGKTSPSQAALRSANIDNGNDLYEENQFYYHSNPMSNVTLLTDLKCQPTQEVIMLQNGEIVSFKWNDTWLSPYFFRNMRYDFITNEYMLQMRNIPQYFNFEFKKLEVNNRLNGK